MPPAVWVLMLNGSLDNQFAFLFQHFLNGLVSNLLEQCKGVIFNDSQITDLHMQTLKVFDLFSKSSAIVNRTGWHVIFTKNTICNSDAMIVITESRSLMDDTSTILTGNIFIYNDTEGPIFKLLKLTQVNNAIAK